MLCAACGESVEASPCESCGSDPLLQGRYRLLSLRGQGGAGTTYRAEDTESGEIVAVKELPLRPGTPDKQIQLFEREAVVLSELSHPGIPRYLDHFSAGRGKHRALYLIQQFIDGTDLQDAVDSRRYSAEEVLRLLLPVLDALHYLHGLSPPVIHRDLKPRNLIQSSAGQVYLVDFGSVRDALADADFGGSTVAGTFGFMAPEQFRGEATAETDLYGVGAVAVALLSRKPLHSLLNTQRQLDWRPHVHAPEAVCALLERLLQADPGARPRTARAVKELVEQLLEEGLEAPVSTALAVVPDAPVAPVDTADALAVPVQPSMMQNAFLGAPTQISIERIVPGSISEDQHARFTATVEGALHVPGRVEAIGELYRWATIEKERRMVRISVMDLGDGTVRIQAWERLSGRASSVMGVAMSMGMSAGVLLSTLGLVVVPAVNIAGLSALGALTLGGAAAGWAIGRGLFPRTYRDHHAQLEAAVSGLERLIAVKSGR